MKNSLLRLILLLVALAFLFAQALPACSTFVLRKGNRLLFGRNFDFFTGNGMIMVNPHGLIKTALVWPGENPATWTSQYGSVTFNQVGREFPMGGMNEAGLVVEMMWLKEAGYPQPDSRPAVMELQWIQYLLDTCSSIDEVRQSNDRVRILPMGSRLHFLILDRSGRALAVEFIDGRPLFYSGDELPVTALTNKPYSLCLQALPEFQGFGGTKVVGTTINDPDRFATLAAAVRQPGPKRRLLERSFAILDQVHCDFKESPTQWRFVYDPRRLEIHIRTRQSPNLRRVRLADFSFDCAAGVKVLDLETPGGSNGDVGHAFGTYSKTVNERLMHETFAIYRKVGFQDLPEEYLSVMASYPDSLRSGQ